MQVLFAVILLAACASAGVPVERALGYHDRVAIPMAKKIKLAEDKIHAANRNSRIVGGEAAAANSHPYLGGLVITYVNRPQIGVCGSVLISASRLLTAAHCWYDGIVQAERFAVVLGSDFLFSGGFRTISYTVVTHPGWDPLTQYNNIAVIILKTPVLLTDKIQPIQLATNPNETFVGEWAVAAGYGFTSDAQSSISVLSVIHEVSVQVISVADCRSVFGSIVQPETMCTSGAGGVGTCRGDAGGPLVLQGNTPKLVGVSTFGAASGCQSGLPSGYSRITSYLGFISENM